MTWATIQQLIRIGLFTAGSFFFGDAVANGEQFQAFISGAVQVGAFVWWMAKERGVVA